MQDGGAEGGGGGGGDIHLLLSILADGEEQARQLAAGELPGDDDVRYDYYRGAARRLQCTLGRAVSAAKAIEAAAASGSSRDTDRSDSPRSADESSGRTATEAPQERQGVCKRRKGLPRRTVKFRVPDANMDATPEDGFSWRKYGQKDILGAKFPRGYYRCTYRTAQACPATKQVQRSDADMCVFDVTYQGAHTCHQKLRPGAAAAVTAHGGGSQSPPQDHPIGLELLAGLKDCLKVETAEPPPHSSHDIRDHYHGAAHSSAPFSFPGGGVAPDDDTAAAAVFSPPSAGSSYYTVPHCLVAAGSYDYDLPARGVQSELGEVVSKATARDQADLSAAAAPAFDYSLYHPHGGEFDPHLPFPPFGGPYYQ